MQSGRIEEFKHFNSDYVIARNIDVWLPPQYFEDNKQRFPVIYVQDGQNLFDPKKSFAGVDWGLDKAVMKLLKKNKIKPAIIIGIWNSPNRMLEYLPQKPFEQKMPPEELKKMKKKQGEFLSDNYLKFMIYELKPFMDNEFRTLDDRENTYVMGSSLGGLISLYALCEYSYVFSAAACLSTHWPAVDGVIIPYLQNLLSTPDSCKLYFDYGDQEEEDYERHQRRVERFFTKANWTPDKSWISRKFENAAHSEEAWRQRVHIPLSFILAK